MQRRIKLFVEINGLLVPIHIDNENKVIEVLGIREFDVQGKTKNTTQINHYSNSHYRQITTLDIKNFILDNLESKISTIIIAQHFGIDIAEGTNNKTKKQILAYNKVYRNFKTARKQIENEVEGTWIEKKIGFKNPVSNWVFKKNEMGV